MEVKTMFKGVTYDMLTNDKLIEMVQSKFPNLKFIHEEYDAAGQSGRKYQRQMTLFASMFPES